MGTTITPGSTRDGYRMLWAGSGSNPPVSRPNAPHTLVLAHFSQVPTSIPANVGLHLPANVRRIKPPRYKARRSSLTSTFSPLRESTISIKSCCWLSDISRMLNYRPGRVAAPPGHLEDAPKCAEPLIDSKTMGRGFESLRWLGVRSSLCAPNVTGWAATWPVTLSSILSAREVAPEIRGLNRL